jgi:hypothetical protein
VFVGAWLVKVSRSAAELHIAILLSLFHVLTYDDSNARSISPTNTLLEGFALMIVFVYVVAGAVPSVELLNAHIVLEVMSSSIHMLSICLQGIERAVADATLGIHCYR